MDLSTIAAAAVGAIREQLPVASPLVGIAKAEGRMDVLAARALERMAHGCGDPSVVALYEGARPVLDTALMQCFGPRRVKR